VALLTDRDGFVAILTINRPEVRNALDADTMAEIGEALVEFETDDSVRAIVLTGAGEKAFCAGMDLRGFSEGADTVDRSRPGLEVMEQRVYPKPLIGAANGVAVAGGFEILLSCDLVVAARHARFGLPEVKHALIAAGGGARLASILPAPIALEILLTGELFSAERALELGLVNRVVDGPAVLATAVELAQKIASNGPLAVITTKRLARGEIGPLSTAALHDIVAPVFASEDAKEGALAFTEKRAPVWTGR
jgi:enoyl-CoA hydratase